MCLAPKRVSSEVLLFHRPPKRFGLLIRFSVLVEPIKHLRFFDEDGLLDLPWGRDQSLIIADDLAKIGMQVIRTEVIAIILRVLKKPFGYVIGVQYLFVRLGGVANGGRHLPIGIDHVRDAINFLGPPIDVEFIDGVLEPKAFGEAKVPEDLRLIDIDPSEAFGFDAWGIPFFMPDVDGEGFSI